MTDVNELAERCVSRLTERGSNLSVVESCTGGKLAAAITSVPGASIVFIGGLIAYSDIVKTTIMGVDQLTLDSCGAVSGECACELSCNGEVVLGSDYTIAITGIAGPGGGTEDKPVGTVFIAWSGPEGVDIEQHLFTGDRLAIQDQSVYRALEKLLEILG